MSSHIIYLANHSLVSYHP